MERVAKNHLVAERVHLGGGEPAHGGIRGQRHERRRADLTVRQMQDARAGAAVAGVDAEASRNAYDFSAAVPSIAGWPLVDAADVPIEILRGLRSSGFGIR